MQRYLTLYINFLKRGKDSVGGGGLGGQEAFQQLKLCLIVSPVLVYPDPKKLFILDTDASDVGIRALMSQEDGGLEQVVAYASRSLKKQELKYTTAKKELIIVVTFSKNFKHYFIGREFCCELIIAHCVGCITSVGWLAR